MFFLVRYVANCWDRTKDSKRVQDVSKYEEEGQVDLQYSNDPIASFDVDDEGVSFPLRVDRF